MSDQWTLVAAGAITAAKRLAPAKAPKADPDLAEAWAEQMAETGLPPQVWERAAKVWATELVEDHLDFKQLYGAAKLVLRRMESGTYEQRLWVEQWRARRLQDRYRALGLGDGGVEIPSAPQDRSLPPDRRSDEQFLAQLRSAPQNANKGEP